MLTKRITWGIILTLFASIIQACGGASTPPPELDRPIKVFIQPFLTFAPFFIAEQEGYFADQGLEVEFVRLENPQNGLALFVAGDLDVYGSLAEIGLFNSINQGANLRIVAEKGTLISEECISQGAVGSTELLTSDVLNDPTLLAGRTIATRPGSVAAFFIDKYLEPFGLSLADMTVISMPVPAMAEAMEESGLDLATVAEPWITRMNASVGAEMVIPGKDVMPNFTIGVTVFGPVLLEEYPETGIKFLTAYMQAVHQYNEGKTERNIEIISEGTGIDAETLRVACWSPFRDDGMIDFDGIEEFQQWGAAGGFLDVVIAKNHYWEPSLLEAAKQAIEEISE